MLVGRGDELAVLAEALATARAGRAASLLVVGEPGIGKTALLTAVAARAEAAGMTVVLVTAVEAESDLVGSGLSLMLPRLGAPRSAGPGTPWDLLSAVAEQAGRGPLALLVDDAQWLDAASLLALGFTIRRLLADAVAVIVAGRPEIAARAELADVPRLPVTRLADDAATELLRRHSPTTPPDAAQAIASALGGVPLALVEAPDILPAAVMAGRRPVEQPVPVGESIRTRYAEGVDALPPASRRALVLAAAHGPDDAAVLAEALRRDGVDAADLAAAAAAGLLRLTPEPQFRHPLVRSAVYASATPAERQHAHRVLADVLRGHGGDARWLRHAALGADGPDEDLAAALEAAALAAGTAGEGAALAYRAAALTPPGIDRWRRLTTAAELSPADPAAATHVRAVSADCPDPVLRARAALVLPEVAASLTEVAGALDRSLADDLPADLRARVLTARIYVAMHAADLDTVDRLAGVVARSADADVSWQVCFALGCTYTFRGRHREGVRWLRAAAARSADVSPDSVALAELFDWATIEGWLGADPVAHRRRIAAAARRWRAAGEPATAANAALMEGEIARRDGAWHRAAALWEPVLAWGPAAGGSLVAVGTRLATLAACQGRADVVASVLAVADRQLEVEGNFWLRLWVDHARGQLALTEGRLEDAVAALERVRAAPFLGRGCRDAVACSLVLLAEAYAALDRRADAVAAAVELEERLSGIVDEHGLAIVDRAHAVAGTDDPRARFRAALGHHGRTEEPFDRARTQLLFGEWLRRNRRPTEARGHLREAAAVFDAVQAVPWATRARAELTATGEVRVVRDAGSADPGLTTQELRIALAVAEGHSNTQIAAGLFLSVKTVEFHLTRVYRKLGVSSRGGVARALTAAGLAA